MPIFLDTSGNSSLGIALCARCSRKFPIGELMADPNSPGLMVCRDDLDEYDPYRLPARQTEDITLPFVRPDTSLALTLEQAEGPIDEIERITEDDFLRVTEDDEDRVTQDSSDILPP